jgi:hypothetical protein
MAVWVFSTALYAQLTAPMGKETDSHSHLCL